MARFEFDDPDAFAEDDDPVAGGVGEAADGRIRAMIGSEGRLARLDLAPELLQHDRDGGTLLDSVTLAAEITKAVNTAIDDYVRHAAGVDTAEVTAELTQVGDAFKRAISEVTADLERAERRLDSR